MTEREASERLSRMLPCLYGWALELDKIEEPSPQDRTRPLPPASEADIASAEKRLRFKLPPSYRAFLKFHDGWKNFSFDWWVSGVSGRSTPTAEKEWKRAGASFEKDCRKAGATTIARLRSESKTDAAVMYWPDHVPLAVDFNGGFMVFDRNRCRDDGECEIVEIRAEEVERRVPNFLAVVEWALSIARRELEIHGRNPDTIPPVVPGTASPTRKAGGTTGTRATKRAPRWRSSRKGKR
jgi:cell wall assembly regulator SMI1